MTTGLFRSEVLLATSEQQFGAPVVLMPWSWWALTGLFAAFAVSILAFKATATFPRKETAAGVLRYPLGELRISPSRAGVLKQVFVRDGQTVSEGEVLAFITTEQHMAEGDVYDARVLAAVERERAMLEARLCEGALRAAAAKALEEIRRDHSVQITLDKED